MFQLSEQQWFVVYSKPQKEECATFHMRAKGLEVFFPRLLLPESSKRRKRLVPLFPNYLFVRLRIFSNEYHYATWAPGVKRIIGCNGAPTPLDEQFVKFLMVNSDESGTIVARANLRTGQEVRILGGPFDGLMGIIQEPPNAKGRVKILLKLLNRDTHVNVPIEYLNVGWVTAEDVTNTAVGSDLVS